MLTEQRELIERLVKSNKKYTGNEDLLEDFVNETFQRSYIIFNSVSSVSNVENYIGKVVSTAIVNVLKNAGRVIRTAEGYVSSEEIIARTQSLSDSNFMEIADPQSSFEPLVDYRNLLELAFGEVSKVNKLNPLKRYLDIFYLRYVKQYRQSAIAKELEISQGEVSKRLLELAIIIKAKIE